MVKDVDGKEVVSYTFPADTIVTLFQYLGTKPYIEVSALISHLDSAAKPNYKAEESTEA